MSARLSIERILERVRAIRSRRDAGVTLTELLVAIGLSTLVGALTLNLFLLISRSSSATIDRTINSSGARNTILAWTAYLRVADGPTAGVRLNRIEWLSGNDMLFYSDLYNRSISNVGTTGAPTMIWLRLDIAGNLVEEQFPSNAAVGANPTVCRVLVNKVSTPATPLFSAIDVNGSAMPTGSGQLGTAPSALAGCRPLPVTVPSKTAHPNTSVQTNLQNVNSVTIDFVVRDTRNEHPLEFTSQAVLPALGGM